MPHASKLSIPGFVSDFLATTLSPSVDVILLSVENGLSLSQLTLSLHIGLTFQFLQNQTVSARITTDTWVMGVIIGVAHICAKVTTTDYWTSRTIADCWPSNRSQGVHM